MSLEMNLLKWSIWATERHVCFIKMDAISEQGGKRTGASREDVNETSYEKSHKKH